MSKTKIAILSELNDREPAYGLVANVDLVIIRYDDQISVLYGRCHHRGALLADGYIDGENLICGVHFWDYRYDTGISEYHNTEQLAKFYAWVEDDVVYVDEDEIREWKSITLNPIIGTNIRVHIKIYTEAPMNLTLLKFMNKQKMD